MHISVSHASQTSAHPRHATLVSAQEGYAQAEAELLDGSEKKKRRSGATATGDEEDQEDAFFNSLTLQGKVPKFAELLKFKVRMGYTL